MGLNGPELMIALVLIGSIPKDPVQKRPARAPDFGTRENYNR